MQPDSRPQQSDVGAALWSLQILGGGAVLVSYGWSAAQYPDLLDAMWGGVPSAWRTPYVAWMFVAAAGYLVATARLLGLAGGEAPEPARQRLLAAAYGAILLPSALWMPLTGALLAGPAPGLWPLVVAVLWIVAAGSLALLALAAGLAGPGRSDPIASLGVAALSIQTVLLDAVIWVAVFTPPAS